MLKVREGISGICSTTALAFDADDVHIDGPSSKESVESDKGRRRA